MIVNFRIIHVIIYIVLSLLLSYGTLWTIYHQFTDLIPNAEIFIIILLYVLLLALSAFVNSTSNLIEIHYALGLRKTTVKYIFMALFFAILIWLIDYWYQVHLLQIDIKKEALNWSLSKKGGNWILIFTSMVILAPLIEEILFRWFFLQTALHYLSQFWSAILISLLFAGVHFSLILFPSAFLASLFYVYLTIKSKSLIPAIMAHIINNFLTFIYYTGLLNSV